MSFSCKIVLGDYLKDDGLRRVYLRAIMDRLPARVPVGFYINEKFFDAKHGRIKSSHPNADTFNVELMMIEAKANNIASKFRIQNKKLTPSHFRDEFNNPGDGQELISFMRRELALRGRDMQENTIKSHNTVINKLEEFKKKIAFNDVNYQLIQRFKNTMIEAENKSSSIDKVLKVVKYYLDDARHKGIDVEDPFKLIKIKAHKSNRMALSEAEVQRLDKYYEHQDCPASHKKLLRYFLFSCYTGLRISDIGAITWNNIHDDLLIYTPIKTKKQDNRVTVPLTIEKKYLPEYKQGNGPIFSTFSDPVSNRYLKDIAGKVGIKKAITYHTSRHTFGSMMAEGGHLPETQKMMGHGNIRTTMEYIHTNTKNLVDAKNKRFAVEPKNNT